MGGEGRLSVDFLSAGRPVADNKIWRMKHEGTRAPGIATGPLHPWGGRRVHVTETETLRQERDLARQRIDQLERALVEAQRLATVGQLASRMAHEFNNLLQVIIGRASLAVAHPADADLKDKAIAKTIEYGRKAADIATNLLGYSNGGRNHSETVPADRLMEAAANLVAWDLDKSNIRLLRRYTSSTPVRVVPARIEQVLLNLILNSREAMHEKGGTLTLLVAPAETPGYVALAVQDTGCGIPPENLQRIFEPFFTTRSKEGGNGRRAVSGTGLGLAGARDLVQQAGGEIHVKSSVGVGSTLTILLPAAETNHA